MENILKAINQITATSNDKPNVCVCLIRQPPFHFDKCWNFLTIKYKPFFFGMFDLFCNDGILYSNFYFQFSTIRFSAIHYLKDKKKLNF